MTLPFKTSLVLGGARSGKSRYAERLVEQSGLDRVYLATGQAGDDEMAARIAAHRARRGSDWTTVEEPLELAGTLKSEVSPERCILIDCLTLWLSNLTLQKRDIARETAALVDSLADASGPVVLVSIEVGLGIVPDNVLARGFRDHQGELNQRVAAIADHVVFIAAGLPLTLKPHAVDPVD